MNRIIIIGNGFDLAHKLETSFYHFIGDYLTKVFNEILIKGTYRDKLLNAEVVHNFVNRHQVDTDDINSVITFFAAYARSETRRAAVIWGGNSRPRYEPPKDSFILSELLSVCLRGIVRNKGWVDIEEEYFQLITSLKKGRDKNTYLKDKEKYRSKILQLNEELNYLKCKLADYLSGLNTHRVMYIDGIAEQFQDSNKKRDFICDISGKGKKPSKLYFVNFNYTNTLKQYLKDIESISHEVNHIHGSLCGTYGQPIFGYADDLNEDFQSFEAEKVDELYDNIKTFAYNNEANYANLMRTLNEGDYQVAIYGHSCGLSDRTLLNKIFEHKNCQSIKVFYYQDGEKDDFKEKRYAIYRLFEDKTLLNDRLVNKKDSEAMAQLDEVIIDEASSN